MANRMAFLICIAGMLGAGGQGYARAQEAGAAISGVETNLTRQQKVNRASLLEGSSEQVRIDAAIELLLSVDKGPRYVLLNVLRQNDNPPAQAAVCKALAQARSLSIKDKRDFFDPIFGILIYGSEAQGKIAAEGTVLFDYKSVSERVNQIVNDPTASGTTKRNAIYALKLRPEKPAIFDLIRFLQSSERQVSYAAALALQDSLGIPVGTDPEAWEQIVKDLERKGADEFVRDRLVRQEIRVHQLEGKITELQGLYLSSLYTLYDAINSDTERAAFLKQKLNSDELVVRIWALDRVTQWRMSSKPLPAGFGPILLSMVSSDEPAVRLATAKLLAFTSYLNPAEDLLKQLEIEREEVIRLELFGALGEACNYAKLNPEVKVSDAVYASTLNYGGRFLMDREPKKVQKAAEVLGKLLGTNGLAEADVKRYVQMFVDRYEQEKDEPNAMLRGVLLGEMAGLCGSTAHRAVIAASFEPLFHQGLATKSDAVREASIAGLIKIDEIKAFTLCKQLNLADNGTPKIRTAVIELAGKLGTADDLGWLSAKVNANGEGDSAWKAMIEVFKRSNATILADWVTKFEAQESAKLVGERKATLLEMAEQKAQSENNTVLMYAVRKRLAKLYTEKNQTDKAAKYYGMLVEASSGPEREEVLAGLVETQLKASQFDAAAQILANKLLEKDLDVNNVLVSRVDGYLSQSGINGKSQALVKTLVAIKVAADRLMWQQQVEKWKNKYISIQYEPKLDPNKVALRQSVYKLVTKKIIKDSCSL